MDNLFLPIESVTSSQFLKTDFITDKLQAPQQGNPFQQIFAAAEQAENNMQAAITDLASGKADNLHQVMIAMEESRLHFELFLQVRNKALEAYQELLRIQI